MNLKKSLASIIVLSIFMTGCNLNKGGTTEPVADKATQQKTMTKVQNDVNEIMDKDYSYVLQNMGMPYCTTYYIDTAKVAESNITSLKELRSTTKTRLIYPKYTSDNKLEKSALYIELNNDKVVEVQTYEFSKYDIKVEDISKDTNIIVDMYDDTSALSLENIKSKDFTGYVGYEVNKLNNVINIEECNFEAYDRNREEMIMGYFLTDEKDKVTNILTIFESGNEIKEIKIVDEDQTMNLIKDYLIK